MFGSSSSWGILQLSKLMMKLLLDFLIDFLKYKGDQTFTTFLYVISWLKLIFFGIVTWNMVIYPYIELKFFWVFQCEALKKFQSNILFWYRGRWPHCKLLYPRKFISIKKWRTRKLLRFIPPLLPTVNFDINIVNF